MLHVQKCCSVTQSCPTLQPHGLQWARPPCRSSSPEVCPSSCPLHQWCHPANSSSDALFSCPQSFPPSGTLPMIRLFTTNDQNIGASACISPSNEYSGLICLKFEWFDLLAVQGTEDSSPAPHFKGIHSLAVCLDLGSIRGLGRSPGEGKGCPLQYSGLENFMDCV